MLLSVVLIVLPYIPYIFVFVVSFLNIVILRAPPWLMTSGKGGLLKKNAGWQSLSFSSTELGAWSGES